MVDIKILNKYYEDGLLMKQTHPYLPLIIWNYTLKTQYESLWDEITLMCRGLITDFDGNIVARPLRKFFNLEENKHIPTEDFDVWTKEDGFLGILFNYNDEWMLSSRGSFTYDGIDKGYKILEKYRMTLLSDKDVYEAIGHKDIRDYTIIGEIITKEKRIVVDYGNTEDFIVLSAINRNDGSEMDWTSLTRLADILKIPLVKKWEGFIDYPSLKNLIGDNQEGFVVKFTNGHRIKIKGSEYIRLHMLMTNISTRIIWESLVNGDNILDLLVDVPDEYYDKIRDYITKLNFMFKRISEEVGTYFDDYVQSKNFDISDRKSYAEWVFTMPHGFRGILFLMYDANDYSELVWNLIWPKFYKF